LQEREIWQIARESITNAERHAEASRLLVEWHCSVAGAELAIRDNGKGFKKGAGRQDSYGLVGMRERAASMGALFDLKSEPGAGTAVIVRLINVDRGEES
jgi:signal transduction histidine kinase